MGRIVIVLNWYVHLLHAAQVIRQVLTETPRNKRPSRIATDEEIVASARPVNRAVRADVENRPVDCEVEW